MNIRENRGITLVMLVVTIVVLLILSGITISAITGGESTMDKASQAKNETEIKEEMEKLQEVINQSASKGIRHGNFSGSADATTIRSALKKTDLIVENPDDVIIDGQSEWIVTGNKTNTQYAIQYNGEVIRLIDTGSIKVGDIVNYTPSGTYNWDAEYATSYTSGTTEYNNANQTLDSSTDDFKLTTWKVLNIDRKTGNIDLVPSSPTIGTLRLHGSQGYNNGVKLLNDACNSLYGNSSKGIIARSIKIEDIEDTIKKVNPSSLSEIATNPIQLSELTKANSWYPTIYKQEKNSVIDGVKNCNATALNKSEQKDLIERTDEDATNGKLQATSSIQPYKNYYTSYQLKNSLQIYKDILLPNNTPSYWLASRFIVDNSNGVLFSINFMIDGTLKLNNFLLYSGGKPETSMTWPLFPVVTINYNLLEETTTPGTYNVK